ncbi:MAG TPA: hypothetical protein VGA78_07400 [Gemmatimonadales bacterium]
MAHAAVLPFVLCWWSKRRLLSLQRESITAIPVHTVRRPWIR